MRLAAIVIAVALLAGAFFFGKKLERDAADANVKIARDGAEKAATDAVTSLEKTLALFQTRTNGAANAQQMRPLLSPPDPATIHDALSNEAWSQPYRDRGGSVALFTEDGKLGGSPAMLDDSRLAEMAKAALQHGEASGFATHQGLYLIGAVQLPFELAEGKKVALVRSRPLGQDELDALSTRALLVTDGKVKAGTRGDPRALESVVGREAEGFISTPTGVAVARQAGALWVWVLEPVGSQVAPQLPVPAVWGGAAVLALGMLAFAFTRKKAEADRAVTEPAPVVMTPISLAQALDATSVSEGSGKRYHEVAPLGEGGMAKVSIAVTHGAEGFRRTFVLKRLRTELTVNPEIVAQFIDEARLGASLVHSNIVPVFDFGRDAEGYFLVQDYIMGRDLDAVRRALFEQHRATLDLPLVLYVAQEALKALSYAHGKTDDAGRPLQLVHRDVSPNNLMISARGELKLLDFGIVKAAGKLSQTQTGMIKGNVFYMSPEQARGLPVDNRSDLFSLGLVLFTACAGEPLYRGNSNYELLTRAAEGLGQDELQRVSRLPAPLAELLVRVLQFDPNNRFSSAEEFSNALPVGQVGSAAAMQQLMEALFKGDFTAERQRFSASSITGGLR
ncbi:MAG: serine/threonine protein kinase [Myxococcaceae bacterium]|nr:serine/threonine protein kinase [Myxococcaceae bacterium]